MASFYEAIECVIAYKTMPAFVFFALMIVFVSILCAIYDE